MRKILGVFLAMGLLGATLGFAQDRLGAGGSFALGSPVLDVFLEFPARDTTTRFALGLWAFAPGGNMAFSVDASLLFARALGGFDVYFGGGVGGVATVAGGLGGVVAIRLTVNALGGAYFPVNETFALYGQIKLLGLVNLATMSINALLMPGFGLCVAF